ncbi:MAG: hypothetical protein Q4D04_03240 [Clostridia bacterium]|nr:hypothetical protein [Clostridia bacterium]
MLAGMSEGEAYARPETVEGGADEGVGCIFCLTGREASVAEAVGRVCEGARGCVARRVRRKTERGVTTLIEDVLFPGYVFFSAPSNFSPQSLPREDVIRVLATQEGDWRQRGDDERIIRWFLSRDGLLGFSSAYREGQKVRIAEGPLKDLESRILRLDRRNQNGQVMLTVGGRSFKVWLGFDMIDRM